MKKLLLLGVIILQTISLYSQINKENISFELRYPITSGDNYLNKGFDEGYYGLIDFGVDYNILKKNRLGIGILFNTSMLRLSKTNVNLFILSPKIKIDYEFKINKLSIVPQLGFGYSNWRFRAPEQVLYDDYGNGVIFDKFKNNENGLTVKGGVKCVLNTNNKLNWYLLFAYEFTKLEKPSFEMANVKYNRNMHLIYPGIGVIWNFGKN